MFRELLFISTILGVASFGTEIVFRFRPDNNVSQDKIYINQSNAVLVATAFEVLAAIYTTKVIEFTTPLKMKITTVIVIIALVTAIIFRSFYGYFLPLQNSQLNLYNATSFFICLTTVIWLTFWFFKKEDPLIDTVNNMNLDERNYQERVDRREAGVTRSADDHYQMDDEPLPSYYELPTPPLYVKDTPDVSQEEAHASTRTSYQNTTVINISSTTNTPVSTNQPTNVNSIV